MKYSLIKNHAYSLIKVVEKFRNFILGNHSDVRTPLSAVKFFFSQNLILKEFTHFFAKIKEHNLSIVTTNTIKCQYLALHLAQYLYQTKYLEFQNQCFVNFFFVQDEKYEL